MVSTNKMWEEDANDLEVFDFYRKLPHSDRLECEIFITPEKIYNIQEADFTAVNDLENILAMLRNISSKDIALLLTNNITTTWSYYTIFKRVVSAIKEYYQLRPEMIEKYPELLV